MQSFTIDDFQIGHPLGKGKFGNVHLVHFNMALKVLCKSQREKEAVEHQLCRKIKTQLCFIFRIPTSCVSAFQWPSKDLLDSGVCPPQDAPQGAAEEQHFWSVIEQPKYMEGLEMLWCTATGGWFRDIKAIESALGASGKAKDYSLWLLCTPLLRRKTVHGILDYLPQRRLRGACTMRRWICGTPEHSAMSC